MKVLVIGSTGRQGGAVARLLLRKGHEVLAFTRHADGVAAKELSGFGAEIVAGDLEDRASIERAARGVDAIFAVATPYEAGVQAEERQGVNAADAARAAGKYMVYSSVASADRRTGIPHFDSKWNVEKHIHDIGAEAAVIAPVYFMDNLLARGIEALRKGLYSTPLAADRKLQQIAVADVAAMAVAALEDRTRFAGRRIDIASDDLSGQEAADILAAATDKPVKYVRMPMEDVRKISEDAMKMYDWFTRVGYSADIKALRRDYPEVGWHTYETWANEQDWQTLLGAEASAAHGAR
jgi:uncharacterized protein YbjT (DUF2867 family)